MTAPPTADVGREAVYAAESDAFEGTVLETLVPFDQLQQLAERIVAAEWWPHGPIEVVSARRDARSSSTRSVGEGAPVVRLAGPQLTAATLVHEFAHVLAGVGNGHGPTFRRAHVDLARAVLSDAAARWLEEAYATSGLTLGKRTWASPPSASSPVADISGDGFSIVR